MTIENPNWRMELVQEPWGWIKYLEHEAMLVPGVKPASGVTNAIWNYEQTWKSLKKSYQDAWKTPEGQGKIAFEVATAAISVLKAAKLSRIGKVGEVGEISSTASLVSKLKKISVNGLKAQRVKTGTNGKGGSQ